MNFYERIQASVLFISACVLVFGTIWVDESLLLIGAAIYVGNSLLELLLLFVAAKKIKTGSWKPNKRGYSVSKWLNIGLTFSGLLLAVASSSNPIYALPGFMIWGTALFSYFLAGLILRHVGGVPLYMSRHSGWVGNSLVRQEKEKD